MVRMSHKIYLNDFPIVRIAFVSARTEHHDTNVIPLGAQLGTPLEGVAVQLLKLPSALSVQ